MEGPVAIVVNGEVAISRQSYIIMFFCFSFTNNNVAMVPSCQSRRSSSCWIRGLGIEHCHCP